MTLEAHVKSFDFKFSTRPSISKQNAQKLDLKKWETSLRDFNENSLGFASSESLLYQELNLCKEKNNRIPNKIFCENVYKALKRKSTSENNIIKTDFSCLNCHPKVLSSDLSSPKEKKNCLQKNTNLNICDLQEKTFVKKILSGRCADVGQYNSKLEQMRCAFTENTHKFQKNKSTIEKNIKSDFSCLNNQSKFLCSFSSDQSLQNGTNTCLLRNSNYDIQASFEKKTPSLRCFNSLQHHSNLKLEQYPMCKKRDLKMPALKCNFSTSKAFSPDNREQILSKCASFINNSSTESSFRTAENFKVANQKSLAETGFRTVESFKVVKRKSSTESFKVVKQKSSTECCFRTTESFEEMKDKSAKVNQEKHLLKSDLVSAVSLKCVSSSMGVGSDWVHSLQEKVDKGRCAEKKKIQGLLVGGYCEQILKFQRRELSEKAIREHKNESKNTSDSVLMRINSTIHDCEIVVAECCLLDKSPEEMNDVFVYTCIVLFQKSQFHKQHMKAGKLFLLSPPWHLIQMESFMCPVIVCKCFKAAVPLEQDWKLSTQNDRLMKKKIEMTFKNLEPTSSV